MTGCMKCSMPGHIRILKSAYGVQYSAEAKAEIHGMIFCVVRDPYFLRRLNLENGINSRQIFCVPVRREKPEKRKP